MKTLLAARGLPTSALVLINHARATFSQPRLTLRCRRSFHGYTQTKSTACISLMPPKTQKHVLQGSGCDSWDRSISISMGLIMCPLYPAISSSHLPLQNASGSDRHPGVERISSGAGRLSPALCIMKLIARRTAVAATDGRRLISFWGWGGWRPQLAHFTLKIK